MGWAYVDAVWVIGGMGLLSRIGSSFIPHFGQNLLFAFTDVPHSVQYGMIV